MRVHSKQIRVPRGKKDPEREKKNRKARKAYAARKKKVESNGHVDHVEQSTYDVKFCPCCGTDLQAIRVALKLGL